MKIVSMNCPHCGGTVKITDDQKSCICPFCDSALTIDDGKFHIVDEAKIKEIDFEQQKYQDEQQKEESSPGPGPGSGSRSRACSDAGSPDEDAPPAVSVAAAQWDDRSDPGVTGPDRTGPGELQAGLPG